MTDAYRKSRPFSSSMDQYKTPEASRRLTSVFLDAGRFGSWPIVASPAVPSERIKILRDAFLKATSDAGFVAEANKKQLETEPIRGEELEALAKEVINQPAGNRRAIKRSTGEVKQTLIT